MNTDGLNKQPIIFPIITAKIVILAENHSDPLINNPMNCQNLNGLQLRGREI